jgi:hypothetical protein
VLQVTPVPRCHNVPRCSAVEQFKEVQTRQEEETSPENRKTGFSPGLAATLYIENCKFVLMRRADKRPLATHGLATAFVHHQHVNSLPEIVSPTSHQYW